MASASMNVAPDYARVLSSAHVLFIGTLRYRTVRDMDLAALVFSSARHRYGM